MSASCLEKGYDEVKLGFRRNPFHPFIIHDFSTVKFQQFMTHKNRWIFRMSRHVITSESLITFESEWNIKASKSIGIEKWSNGILFTISKIHRRN